MTMLSTQMDPASGGAAHAEACRERLSALADGELDPAGALDACDGWKADAAQRQAWHAYHVIGDVLRSEELAGCRADARFVQALRARLEAEPVVLAPAPLLDAERRGRRWSVPAAVAAGLVLAVGAFTVTRPIGEGAAVPVLAQGGATAPAAVSPTAAVTAAAAADTRVADGRMVRDPRLDAYLAAHKQSGGTTALAVPSAWLRAAPADAPRR